MLLIRSCGLWGCCFGSFSAAPHFKKAISSNDFDDILHQKYENSLICFAMLDYLQGTQEAKHVLLRVLSKHSKVAFPLGPNPGLRLVLRSHKALWEAATTGDHGARLCGTHLWIFELLKRAQTNKQTNKQPSKQASKQTNKPFKSKVT